MPRLHCPSPSPSVSPHHRSTDVVATPGAGPAASVQAFDASPRAVAQAVQLQSLFGTGVAQRKGEAAVRQELANGSLLANLQGNFITNHGQGVASNVDAAKVHARRANVPQTNTVIKDLHALKHGLAGAPFAAQGADDWRVTTAAAIDMVDTTKKDAPIGPEAAAAKLVPTNLGGEAFVYDDDAVASVSGLALSDEDLAYANQQAGTKPKGSAKPQKKNAYRLTFLQAVNTFRREQAAAGDLAWVKANFTRVTGTALAGVAPAAINAIAPRQQRVRVFIQKSSGDIWHLDGYE